MRVPRYDLCVEPGDSSVVGLQPWLTRVHESAATTPPQLRSRGILVPRCAVSATIPPPLVADVVRLIVVGLLGSADGREYRDLWRLGRHAEHRLLPRAAQVQWAEGERLQPQPGWSLQRHQWRR